MFTAPIAAPNPLVAVIVATVAVALPPLLGVPEKMKSVAVRVAVVPSQKPSRPVSRRAPRVLRKVAPPKMLATPVPSRAKLPSDARGAHVSVTSA